MEPSPMLTLAKDEQQSKYCHGCATCVCGLREGDKVRTPAAAGAGAGAGSGAGAGAGAGGTGTPLVGTGTPSLRQHSDQSTCIKPMPELFCLTHQFVSVCRQAKRVLYLRKDLTR
eukprot:2453475-Amphidinium_carterae.1